MEPLYIQLRAAMGEEGALYAYCDDSYLLAEPEKMVAALAHAPAIFGKVGLRVGLGHAKIKMILPVGYDMDRFPYPMDNPGVATPHVVSGFSSCLGAPQHFSNDQELITEVM